MPAKKRAVKTRHERGKEKEAAKAMIYRGESAAETARALRLNEATVRGWIHDGQWKAQVKEVQQIVERRQQLPTIPQRLAFDFAETKKETRSSWARSSLKVAKWAEETAQSTPEVLFEMGSQYKAHVESSKSIAGDWEDSSASKFAVALNINTLPTGQVIDVD